MRKLVTGFYWILGLLPRTHWLIDLPPVFSPALALALLTVRRRLL